MKVRKIVDNEIEMALALVWEIFGEYVAPDYSEQGAKEFYKSIHEPEWISTLQVYGAFDEDKLAGVLATCNNGKHIALFFVKGAYHKRGIGRTLFEHFLKECPADVITVNSSPYAVPVYHKLGFIDTDKEQTSNGIRYIPMKRNL
ncbi:GNAT family N-acetyltransferase [Agathobaculum sp. NTUH-O15-33]|uniref:GNAT family N-acetyltransferase n=1 Tax=Agathobaculum sp. NTUH-O15-33 TaxID=3079302 RepID=UPI0029585102|nr:GNAT family N-acetyltransferase [Agathobaculum sp. NTUH-O15-33]WNX83834.1 GNAT family N-acetyltransferase [Agathobaculum sp. NTUH-O15-33]